MRIHPYFRVLPRVRLYLARPMRAGCVVRTALILAFIVFVAARLLSAQVNAVLHISGRDAEMRVANPTAKPLKVSITLYRDSTLTDSVPARISPQQFTLAAGASQIVRLRLRTPPKPASVFRLGTLFMPVEDKSRPAMRITLATRLITRVVTEAGP